MILTVTPGIDLTAISGPISKSQFNLLGQPTIQVQAGSIEPTDIDMAQLQGELGGVLAGTNYFRNGNFAKTMWQRGTSTTVPDGTSAALADYWTLTVPAIAGTANATYAREQIGPANEKSLHCAKISGDTGLSVVYLHQDIGSHLSAALARTPGTITFSAWIYDGTGGGGWSPTVYLETADVQDDFTTTTLRYTSGPSEVISGNLASNQWSLLQITLNVDIGTLTNINNGLRFKFSLGKASTAPLDATSKFCRVSQAKLETGSTATDFVVERDEVSEDLNLPDPELKSASFISNIAITTSRTGGAETITVKTKSGIDPSSTDYLTINFRDAALTTGGYVSRVVNSPLSLTIPQFAMLGMSDYNSASGWMFPTLSIASPCVVTCADHQLRPDDPFVFSTSGALPTGLSPGVTYYVSRSGYTAGSHQVSATPGGASINTSGTQSGVHILKPQPKPTRVWLVAADDNGTVRLGVIVCRGINGVIHNLRDNRVTSSTILNTASNSNGIIYSETAWTNKATRIIGYLEYTGLTTFGVWDVAPVFVQLMGPGVQLPGQVVQRQRNISEGFATTTTLLTNTDAVPLNTEGAQFMAQAITPTSACNRLRVRARGNGTMSVSSPMFLALFRDTETIATRTSMHYQTTGDNTLLSIEDDMHALVTTAQTIYLRGGGSVAGTFTWNGNAGARKHGGKSAAYLEVEEIMT